VRGQWIPFDEDAICHNLPFDGGAKKPKQWAKAFVATNVYLRKILEKPKGEGLRILKMRVRELFTYRKGISTPRARHKGWQPFN